MTGEQTELVSDDTRIGDIETTFLGVGIVEAC